MIMGIGCCFGEPLRRKVFSTQNHGSRQGNRKPKDGSVPKPCALPSQGRNNGVANRIRLCLLRMMKFVYAPVALTLPALVPFFTFLFSLMKYAKRWLRMRKPINPNTSATNGHAAPHVFCSLSAHSPQRWMSIDHNFVTLSAAMFGHVA